MTTNDFGMGFRGRNPFDKDARKKFQEEWAKMNDQEKLDLMNKRVNGADDREDFFSVEAIDARYEAWMKKSNEEKTAFVNARKEAFRNRMASMHMHHFHGHETMEFGIFGKE